MTCGRPMRSNPTPPVAYRFGELGVSLTSGPQLSGGPRRADARLGRPIPFPAPFKFQFPVSIFESISFLYPNFKIPKPELCLAKIDDSNFVRKRRKISNYSHWFHPLDHPVALAIK